MKIIPQHNLKCSDLLPVAENQEKIMLNPKSITQIKKVSDFVADLKDSKQPVYGINTGFGALAGVVLEKNKLIQLQENLIYSHSVGSGPNLDKDIVRAAMFLRANMLSKAHSGARPILINMLVSMLNKNIVPVVPETGSVGASGDLSPLAFIARTLLGHGEVYYQNKIIPAWEGLKKAGLKPFKLELKEGLALINGTDIMSASGALVLDKSEYLAKLADIAAAMSMVALQGKTSPFDWRLMKLKPHNGQMTVARNMAKLLSGYKTTGKKVQDAYSLRCIPQFAGAVREGINFAKNIIQIEMNSISDNPIIVKKPESKNGFDIVSGGNFHGQAISLALDTLGIALVTMGVTSERRLFRLLDDKLSGLSPFLVENPGVNSGLMMLQVLTGALVAENKVLAHPASIQSVPTSASQEDFVSMGMTAANKTRRILDNTLTTVAIELICSRQAIELAKYPLPKGLNKFYRAVSQAIPYITDDRLFQNDILNIKKLIAEKSFRTIVENEVF
jgi:histidine ammonia-lyase